jgi:hypothetical protein
MQRAEEWPWSSVRDYTGRRAAESLENGALPYPLSGAVSAHPVLPIDRILLPTDAGTRI